MIEQLNRQRALRFLDAFSSRDLEAALACCIDDVDFVANAPIDIMPHMGHRHGIAEMRAMWETIYKRYSSIRYEIVEMIVEGDKVVANLRAFFRKRGNDRIIQFDIAVFYTFRNGRIAQIREIMDTFDLVQQVLERDVAAVLAETKPHKG
jgi:ketosteroid isomerase-like protein